MIYQDAADTSGIGTIIHFLIEPATGGKRPTAGWELGPGRLAGLLIIIYNMKCKLRFIIFKSSTHKKGDPA